MPSRKIALPFPIPREWGPSTAQAIEDNLQRMFSSSGRIGQGGGSALVNGLDLIVPSVGDMIVSTAAGLFVALPIVATAQRSLTNNGGVPTWALVNVATGVTGVLPLANFFNATNTQRVLGRNTSGGGVFEEVTLSQLLDWIGTAAQGDVLYRGSAGWARLAAGTAGKFLQTAGASADPVWAAISGTNLPIANTSHVEYTISIPASFVNNRGASGSITATSQGHKAAGSILASGQYYQIATAASSSSTASLTSATSGSNQTKEMSYIWDFDVSFIIRTDAAAITSVRYLFGIGVNNEDTDNITTNGYIGIRFSTGAGDTTWVGVTSDGTQSVTAAISAAVAADTRYLLRIRKVSGTVFFSVNGGTEVSTSTRVPSNNVYAHIVCRVTALTNSVRSLWFARLWCDYGT